MTSTPLRRLLVRHFDDALVAVTLGRIAAQSTDFSGPQQAVVEALRRSSTDLRDADLATLGDYVRSLDSTELVGVALNVKGIAHEILFVAAENSDSDAVTAALFPDTNHPGFDVLLTDHANGRTWPVQLKATDDPAAVRDWLEDHENGQIAVTSELASRIGVEHSGFDNGRLIADTESVLDQIQSDATLWSHLPGLTLTSLSIVILSLWRRYRRGDITFRRFKMLVAAATGWKAAKMTALVGLLSTPGLNVITGVIMVSRMLYGGRDLIRLLRR